MNAPPEPYVDQRKNVALEFMEKALEILVTVDDSSADCYLRSCPT